jgi:(2Fe-2S) ferredoxin
MARIGAAPCRAWSHIPMLVVGLAGVACGANGVPAPGFLTPFNATAPDSIREYLGKLEFDKRDGAGDTQFLLTGCPRACRIGPLLSIYPERRSHNNSSENLAEGPGRIVAVLINHDMKDSAPQFNLGPQDTVYWAVDSVRQVKKGLSRGRSHYISARALRSGRDTVVKTDSVFIHEHRSKGLKMAIARWVFDTTRYGEGGYGEGDTPGGNPVQGQLIWTMATWGSCKRNSCC